jgi:hypothetical protein
MPSLAPRKALASLEPTAPSTAMASSTGNMAPFTTPDVPREALALIVATAPSTVTSPSDPKNRPLQTHGIIVKLRQWNRSASEETLEVLAKELCSATGVMYSRFDALLNRQFTVPQGKRVNNENNTTVVTSQGVHEPRFRFWIAKGATQFTKLFSKHPEFDAKDTMKTFF